ncbi:sedoheptulose-1,7-bisphosphatase, chloroplastic-like protein [Tanacetum coccineum]|uniref:Sedoheptulose-1,7-bisphosphatase, chloroplastic-like protein n=1 Tax=Tanacetum coccineum TaxID=301880 RepID=A0ABQ4WJ91_9ASTR
MDQRIDQKEEILKRQADQSDNANKEAKEKLEVALRELEKQKLRPPNVVYENDVQEADRLFKNYTMDDANSGINQQFYQGHYFFKFDCHRKSVHFLKTECLKLFLNGGFSVAFDPLDGSSIVDTNLTVGTIFGVWSVDNLTGVTRRDQVDAALGIYGRQTTYVIAITSFFFLAKINYYIKEQYTLRYTGEMVLDVNQINVKEKVVFLNAISPSTKGKIRLHFEVAPLGLWIENAGYSSGGTCLLPCDGHDLFP